MPKAELCNPCFVAQNAMLQSSQYSIYNTYYELVLKYIYRTCGLSGPTYILPPLIVQEVPTTFCASETFYTTSSGDTCDTIAQAYNVSSSALYRGNQNTTTALDCFNITPGSILCIPMPCSSVYTVLKTDTCESIEAAHSLENGAVRDLNPFIVFGCLNLHISNAIYGNTICLSPQGGTFQPGIPLGNSTTEPAPITGYSLLKIAPPTGATVAAGTTLNCGKWYTVLVGDDCASINVRNGITAELFLTVNPSLRTTDCTATLVAGTTYCVGPTYDWNMILTSPGTTGPTSVSSTATTITTSHTTSMTSSISSPAVVIISSTAYPIAPAPTTTGTTPQCNSWYTVKNGDTCDAINSANGISQSQLVIWNGYLNTACNNLLVGYSICVSSPLVFQFWTSLGCYIDVTTSRTLANQIILPNQDTRMTVELCQQTCQSSGYTFAGLEYAHQCWCANSILNNGPATTGCTSPCPANTSEMCGGSDRINVYSIGNDTTVGCYVDSSTSRTLKNRVAVPNETTIMTHQVCESACERAGYQISGVEYKSECYCDNSIQGAVASSGCDMTCAGNSNQICGGSNRITILTRPQSRYVGCFSDSATARTLVNRYSIANEGTIMTVDLCRNACRTAGYIYSGVEYAQECFCGNTIQTTGTISTGCTMACAGNISQICGGSNRISIYSL